MININENILKPLCVDLDGTIIRTDSLMESILVSLKKNPLLFILFPFWIIRGRYYFKSQIAKRIIPNPKSYPYNHSVIEYLVNEKRNGREIILATASIKGIADSVASEIGIFNNVLSSENSNNLRAKSKRDKLVELYGERGFDYIGDSKADFEVWNKADKAIMVEPSGSMIKKVSGNTEIIKIFKHDKSKFKLILKEIRVYQWLKNILIFFPLLMAHKVTDLNMILNAVFAFISFSLIASAVYVTNDLLDLESDRLHPRKKNRPFASGHLKLQLGFLMSPILMAGGILLAIFLLPIEFFYFLLIYFVLTTTYSFYLKKQPIFDVIVLACLYTLRLVAGATAVNVTASPWLLGFSIFLFLSLAFIKRYTELLVIRELNKNESKGRGYLVEDMNLISNMGPASGYISVMVLALYVNSKEVIALYHKPELLWLVVLCLLFWISRMWLLAFRGKMEDDPLVFTGKDWVSYVVGAIVGILAIGAAL
ncbi:MAG: UbiA family prenyltransferase [Ignavibacteriae bacterium]|nr:UbiA family prenyltransferase [Ignavibacteriota bacterium]